MKIMRRFGVLILPVTLEAFCKNGTFKTHNSPIPTDAKFINCFWDDYRQCFIAVFSHHSFPETQLGENIPIWTSNIEIERLK